MNQKLQNILKLINQNKNLTPEEKESALKALKDADKELEIIAFKLERTEKVKKTTAILLEETIEELEQKRKAVEAQNRELEIETALEKVRTVAMSMNKSDDLISICEVSFKEFRKLGFDQLRNSVIHIPNDEQKYFMDYDFSELTGGAISKIEYGSHPIVDEYLKKIRSAEDAYFEVVIHKDQLKEWKEFRKNSGQMDDPRLDDATALYYYLFSIGIGDIGISAFKPIDDSQIKILKRFRNVFDLAYRRYNDIALAEKQSRESQIELALERVRARTMGMQKSGELKEVIQVVYDQFVQLTIHIEHTGFILDYKARDDMHIWLADRHEIPTEVTIPFFDCAHWNSFNKAKATGKGFFANHLSFKEKNKFYRDLFEFIPGLPEDIKEYYFSRRGLAISTVLLENVGLYIENFDGIPYTEDENNTLMRFGKVFQQTYTRFLDLQKAETQAREAQIEAALERVRSRSMAMHKSEELSETAEVLFEQFNLLGKIPDRMSIGIINEESKKVELWVTDQGGNQLSHEFFFSLDEPTSIVKIYTAWKEKKDSVIVDLTGPNLQDWLLFVKENAKLPIDETKIKGRRVQQAAFFSQGFLLLTTHDPVADNIMHLLVRFAKVFDQTYTRFLDLKKVEAQAREAQIENALEKVRSRTMAMQKSEELSETAKVFFEQIHALGELPDRIGINIIKEDEELFEIWATNQDGSNLDHRFRATIKEPTSYSKLYAAWKAKKDYIIIDLKGQELKKWIKFVREKIKMTVDDKNIKGRRIHNATFFSNGVLLCTTHEPVKDEIIKLLVRFAKVFDQTYRRFLDLQKAEAQARESQIEAALERVRSKTMAMHNSQDVGATVVTLFDEVLKLGLDKSIRVGIGILEGNEGMETWSATSTPEGKVDLKMGMLDMTIHPMLIGLKKAWESGKTGYSYNYIGDDVVRYYKALNNEPEYPFQADLDSLPENEYHKSFFYTEGILFSFAPNPISDEAAKVLDRFAGVFGQTYRRYLDLQKAEAQAQEAKIEASLERVRSKAMAMHSPNDLSETVNVFFKELKNLGIVPIRCGVAQIDEATRTTSLTTTTSSQQGDSFEVIGKIKQTGHPVLDGIIENWKLQKEYHPVLEGADIKAYYNVMNSQIDYPDYSEDTTQFGNLFPFKEGFVFAWTESKLTDEELMIFRRFTSVLSLTYRRYIDLKEAEARSVEAVRQASLDRVRAEIASMRTTNDLEKITPLIWRELTTLGVPFFRCGVFIIDEPNYVAHAYLSTPLGKSLAALHVKIDNTWLENAVKHWRNGEIYHEVWDRNKFLAWTQTMMEQGFVENKEQFQAGKEAPETLSLQLLPFTQGMLYVGSKLPLSNEEIKIAEKLANDFGVAYSRYEDFQKLEAVNHRKTLELEEARQLQLSMLPKELPKLSNLDIAVYMKTATEVGGDYYDFNVGVDGTLTVAIGDATGHGMKAGTIVSMIKALFASGGSKMDMKTYFKQSSDALKGIELGRLMMAFLMLRINSHKLQFANAGMPPLIIYRNQLKEVEEMMIHGMPLGAIKDFPYKISEIEISSGDTILLLSDGLPELKNERNQQYGYSQVKEKFKLAAEKNPDEIVGYLKNSATDWVNGVEPDDDVTLVVLKVK